ncbi:hypothetical protein [Runella zeae]|uniref:hypothetical protein n=1 Tax=Runella zeae TaxID=94255 RepID=UPI002356CE27|nr:hypothetical protein [Runella zeae]
MACIFAGIHHSPNRMDSLWNQKFVRDLLLTVVLSVVVAVACFYGPTIHLPFLVGLIVGLLIGWLQPRKGWILALLQVGLIIGWYFVIEAAHWLTPFDADATKFTALLQFFPVLVGGFLAGFIRRAFS